MCIIVILLDLHGYIVKFGKDESKAGNKYIDVTLRTSMDDYTTIRIMKNTNPNITIAYLDELKNGSNPLHFANLSVSTNGVYFFNSYRKSTIQISHQVNFVNDCTDLTIASIKEKNDGIFDVSGCIRWVGDKMTTTNGNVLREGLIIDQTGNMPITVWKEQIPIICEKQWYHITDVIIKNYFGSKLSTTRRSKISAINTDKIIPQAPEGDMAKYNIHTEEIVKKYNTKYAA